MGLTIGDLGKATSTKVETIRYYERIGLLPKPVRTAGNYRAYSEADLDRLSFIRRARDLGFPLEQVRELLSLSDDKSQPCAAVDRITSAHLRDIDRKIGDLLALRSELSRMLTTCRQGTIADCRIIETLGPALP
ncbi:helix-turn-helix domain-containing protein [Sphingobium sp. DEHP117]|uniref:MerR family transcriptional regulator n=1 Tax=Sphingobium sp. DEHP117 TaxID=2993436 RepID=UPI0027D5BEC3|nr:MerR family DNA-binding protein [Sphingobium sp. DEHP117]MDQ4421590.1 helix-turn-helix domain-containing protein [Sphingobium sp. DEHP117]